MEIVEVTSNVYGEVFSSPSHFFNSGTFNALNEYKCDAVYYLFFKDTKIRMGIVFGIRNNILNAPFSAPFGGFESVGEDIRLQQIDDALQVLQNWASEKQFAGIKIISPSFFYNNNFLNKLDNCLYRAGYEKMQIELNYQFPTIKLDENYHNSIWYNARKNLKRAMLAGITFRKLNSGDGKYAYDIIAQNRKERGFPLRMSWEQIYQTKEIIPIDFFIVEKELTPIGAALVFHVTKEIVQVVYWGDLPEYSEYKTMNFLSYNIFKHYKDIGIAMVDVGPSTENSIPNYGLCEFKESIGCDVNIKTEFFKNLN